MKKIFFTFLLFAFSFSLWAEGYTLRIFSKTCSVEDLVRLNPNELINAKDIGQFASTDIEVIASLDRFTIFAKRQTIEDAINSTKSIAPKEREKQLSAFGIAKHEKVGVKTDIFLQHVNQNEFLANIVFDFQEFEGFFESEKGRLYPIFNREVFNREVMLELDKPSIITINVQKSKKHGDKEKLVAKIYFAELKKNK